ncbi:MAG: DUF3800 domain-containing protein [bacterium]|nr:DUF3800 domain-containing protein [bacterium]
MAVIFMLSVQEKIYHFFLDETGDHGLTFIDENFPIFLLAGCLFEYSEYQKISKDINVFKEEFFKTTSVILHSRDIRKCEGAFQILFDLDLKRRFYERLNKIISDAQFTVIAVAIDKKKHIERYGKIADNPYSICLSYVLERLIFCTDKYPNSKISITIEKRGKKEDTQLLAHYNSVIDRGTFHVVSDRFKKKISNFVMKTKRDNDIGIQIADLCAYPIARHVLNAEEPYIPFKIIEGKLRKGDRGKVDGYGLKVFP